MRRNGEATALVNDLADLACGFSFQVRQLGADTKQVSVRGRYLNSRQDEKVVNRHAIKSHQAFFEQVVHRVTRVVVGDRDSAQTFRLRCRDQIFRAGNSVAGKERMRVQIDIKRKV